MGKGQGTGLTSRARTIASVGSGTKASTTEPRLCLVCLHLHGMMSSAMRPAQASVPQEGRASTSGCLTWREAQERQDGGLHTQVSSRIASLM